MHLINPEHVTLANADAHPLMFQGARGEQLTVSVLDHNVIRVQHYPDGASRLDRTWLVTGPEGETPREGRLRDDLTPFAQPPFALDADGDTVHLRTEQVQVTIRTGDFHLTWANAAGRVFAADLAGHGYVYDRRGSAVCHFMERRPTEHYYGLGESSGPLDNCGRRLRMRPADALGYDAEHSDPLYKHWPFYITFVPELQIAYGLLYDNLAPSVFDFGKEINALRAGPYRYYQADAGDLDYYLLYGPSIERVLETFAALTGYPALPPRWSLGYLGSTMSYTEAPDAQEQLKQFVDLCAQHDIPCDGFHLSSGYTTNDEGQRCVFIWNHAKVPDPNAMADHFHAAGVRLAANIKPYLLTTHPAYNDLAAAGGFVMAVDADVPEVNRFWSGGVYEYATGSYVDFTSAAGFEWWKTQVQTALLDYGIDAAWNDNNEFEVQDDAARGAGFGDPLPAVLIRPLLTLLMARASYAALRDYAPDQRPFVLTRSGCPGIQRYAQTWSGDNTTSWHTLRWNTPMGLSLSLSGMPNCGHDVGGFTGPKPDPELFVRWVQNGVMHPRFTIHSWNTDRTVNEPWMHPEVLPFVREAIRFRYRLMPYFYALFFEAAQTGHPIIRPLVYHFPHDPHCHTESFDFMLGPNLLVASVLEPGVRSREVYLPQGVEWYDFYTGERYAGGQMITAAAPLDRILLFAPAGAIIPFGKVMQHVGAEPDDVREVRVYPPAQGRASFTLIDDDGMSMGYARGEFSALTVEVRATQEALRLAVAVAQDGYALPYETLTVVLPSGETRAIHAYGGGVFMGADGVRRVTLGLP